MLFAHNMLLSDQINVFMKKTYIISVINLKISDKKICFSFFHVIISCIMSSDESENELF